MSKVCRAAFLGRKRTIIYPHKDFYMDANLHQHRLLNIFIVLLVHYFDLRQVKHSIQKKPTPSNFHSENSPTSRKEQESSIYPSGKCQPTYSTNPLKYQPTNSTKENHKEPKHTTAIPPKEQQAPKHHHNYPHGTRVLK